LKSSTQHVAFTVTTGELIFDPNLLGRRYLEFLHTHGITLSKGEKVKGEKVKR
jgi:hypothetical protein